VKTARLLRSATFRLALLYMLIFGGSVAVLLGFLYWATVGVLSEQMDETIQADITGLAEQYERRGTPGIAAIIGERIRKDPGGRTVYLLTDPLRRPLVGNLDSWPTVEPDTGGWITFELVDRADPDGRPHLARAKRFVLQGGLNLLVGREVRELERTRRMIVNAMIWGIAITLALAFAGGIAMSRSTARRIDAINQTSRDIMSGDLDRRIPAGGTGDEFDQLAGNLNAMLDRIQGLMEGLGHVSDNIAHDLRTPLTRLRGRLEDLDDPTLAAGDRTQRINAAVAEADTLLSMFNALLRIAQIEAGGRRDNFATVDLAAVLSDVAELYEPVAQEKGLNFSAHVEAAETVSADRDLLFQSVANLTDNAIKYAPAGGSVTLHATGRSITVSDTGPGVPKEARNDVFRRFHRLEESRNAPGSGLGLSLVKAVAQLHGGEVRLEDNRPGLKAILTLG
jgi:signal transduction histidine kinase